MRDRVAGLLYLGLSSPYNPFVDSEQQASQELNSRVPSWHLCAISPRKDNNNNTVTFSPAGSGDSVRC